MPKAQPIDETLPNTCPECQAKVKTLGVIYDQKKATTVKLFAGIVLVVVTGLVVGGMFTYFDRISLKYLLIAVGVGALPAAIVFGIGNAIPKIKEVKCSKCRWTEYYFVKVNNPGA